MTDPTEELLEERRGPVVVLRLNRPEARNALTPGLLARLSDAILRAEDDPEVRVAVLTATGDRAFCSGMDLRSFAAGEMTGLGRDELAGYYRLIEGEVKVPLVGAANGSAVAGGLELLLGCDLIVASSDAELGLPEVQRGLFPGGGGTAIVQRVPMSVALEMTMTGNRISAQRAAAVGLVNSVVAPDEVEGAAVALAERIAANAPLGVAAAKELVRLAAVGSPETQQRLEHWREVVFGSEDAKEGATAFVERRDPVWRGR
jgi:enoyl-CoA hydratase